MECITRNQLNLTSRMNSLWEQHVFWTRLLIISILESLKDLQQTEERLLKNPVQLGILFGRFYGADAQKIITNLLNEHLVVGAKLVTAFKNNDKPAINELNTLWYDNARRMAETFSMINPFYIEEDLRKMLYNHLDLTKNEVALRLEGKYEEDIKNFDMIEMQALEMANYFTNGIIFRFRNMFTCYL